MSPYYSILKTSGAVLFLTIALFLMIGQTAVLIFTLRTRRNRRKILGAGLHLLAGFLVFVLMLDSYDIVNYPTISDIKITSEWFVFSLPWLAYALLEAVSALILILNIQAYRQFQRTTVTPEAIRQSIDLLAVGICVSAPDGTVQLVNLKMDALCRDLLGERLADSGKLWSYLENHGEEQNGKRLVHDPKGEAWLFSKEKLVIDEKGFERTSAVNVTERYRITEELREKNAHLHEIQRRMKEATELSGEMFIKQEEATARSALHNELGQVLLMGRYFIEHPETTDAGMVALMTRQMNSFLLGESTSPGPDAEDDLHQAVRQAASIGVNVEVKGTAPAEESRRSLLGAAIKECAANTVKHAEGDRLFVEITEKAAGTCMTITNNGKPPKEPIAESGGLLSLRRSVERAGGQMTVRSRPAFSLVLNFNDRS